MMEPNPYDLKPATRRLLKNVLHFKQSLPSSNIPNAVPMHLRGKKVMEIPVTGRRIIKKLFARLVEYDKTYDEQLAEFYSAQVNYFDKPENFKNAKRKSKGKYINTKATVRSLE